MDSSRGGLYWQFAAGTQLRIPSVRAWQQPLWQPLLLAQIERQVQLLPKQLQMVGTPSVCGQQSASEPQDCPT